MWASSLSEFVPVSFFDLGTSLQATRLPFFCSESKRVNDGLQQENSHLCCLHFFDLSEDARKC